ncbi:hypothetical protein AM500_12915 [Bacillus sp. FJAT-18017]|uniref:hypothetical protein n=1 Tax=Bacillus sp. FJAT-18017 TaxID=1705566 RepID=UPI0006AD91E6|nr:hypothetical protein [Bacillus sp. FJAT-18017]ALC90586.1 hypothetical protein AM500_12915 [Bacillus sp. FJAT-18017]
MSIEEFVSIFLDILILWWGVQWTYALTVLLLGSVMVDYYDWGTWEDPQNIVQKTLTFIMAFLIGVGPYFYKKFIFEKKYNWYKWRLAFLGLLIGGGLGAMLVFQMIKVALNFLFL